jgi:hypothetical protein
MTCLRRSGFNSMLPFDDSGSENNNVMVRSRASNWRS